MIWTYKTLHFAFFGKDLGLPVEHCYDRVLHSELQQIQECMQARFVVSAQQEHTNQGAHINSISAHQLAHNTADYIVTRQPGVAALVFTADCIPCILYDPVHNVFAIVHAGWRGLQQHILLHAVQDLQAQAGTNLADMQVFFGPCIFPCCYIVQPSFLQDWQPSYVQASVYSQGALRFDLLYAATLQLQLAGILAYNIHRSYTECTACSPYFWSARRDKQEAQRNIAVAMLID